MENILVSNPAILDGFTRFQSVAYILAALLFILALAGLSKQKSAKMGNNWGILGMVIALVATLSIGVVAYAHDPMLAVGLMVAALAVGGAIGIYKAVRVQMTAMPELVAMLHSFVGAAAVLVGINSFLVDPGNGTYDNAFHMGEVGLAVFIGAVTLTGSIVAWLKLSAKISGKPLTIPGRNAINLVMVIACIAMIAWFVNTRGVEGGCVPLAILTVVSLVLGAHLVLAIGGGDMPVVVSMLTRTPAGRLPWPASRWVTTCSSSPARSSVPPVRSCPTSCARA